MYSIFSIQDKNISVLLHKNSIGIVNDEQLTALVSKMPGSTTDDLVLVIKKEYHKLFNKDFGVTDDSMAIEILGHVFAEKFALAVKAISPVKLVDAFAEKICSHCEIINIGEKDHDHNRIVWDLLAPFKAAIAAML